MQIETIRNQFGGQCILLRQSYRENGKAKKRTIANLSNWSPELVDGLRILLRGGIAFESPDAAFEITCTRPHGHVVSVLETLRSLKLDSLLHSRRSRNRDLVVAMIVARILEPSSKLATAQGLGEDAYLNTLAEEMELEDVSEDDLYAALDWLGKSQDRIEAKLAKRHLKDGIIILYDLTSTYFEGRTCPLAHLGYSRDGKKGKLQINVGLLCTAEGIPVSVEVFDGNTGDPTAFTKAVEKVVGQFGLKRVIFVGDRGMITSARIREDLKGIEGLRWITALRALDIQKLATQGSLQASLFDEKDLAEIQDPENPEERFIACRNPLLAAERDRKRQALLEATEKELDKVVRATQRKRKPLRGKDEIGLRVGKVLGRFKMGKHFELTISECSFQYGRKLENIAKEAMLDGVYIIRTNVASDVLSSEGAVETYKGLSVVERAFRRMKTVDLQVRPIRHRKETRVRAHVFLCMLAYYVEWHMRRALAPLLFEDHDPQSARAARDSIVAPSRRSETAERKAATKQNEDGYPVQSFRSLLKQLSTIAKNTIQPKLSRGDAPTFDTVTSPNRLQQKALELLGVSL